MLRTYVAHALVGIGVAFAAAHTLFELNPLSFGRMGDPLPVVLISLCSAVVLVGLCLLGKKTRSGWADQYYSKVGLTNNIFLLLPILSVFSPRIAPLRTVALLVGGLLGWITSHLATLVESRRWTTLLTRLGPPLALLLISLVLYLRTLAPTVGDADTFEFQVNVIRLAVSHGSGYPLYTLLAKLFSWLPVSGSMAYRINLSAAVFGALAVATCFLVARRMRASMGASSIASLSLGVSYAVWSRAVEAEVYTLNLFLVGLILFLVLSSENTNLAARCIPFLFLTLGLSCANHLTTLLLIPPLVVGLIMIRIKLPFRTWVLSLGLFLLGLAVYLYLPIRWPAVNDGEAMTIERFLYFFTAKNAQVALRPLAFIQDLGRYGIVGRKVLDQYGLTGIVLGLLGLASLYYRLRPAAVITTLVYVAYIFFALSHYSPDPDFSSFLLPAHLVQAVWMAIGVDVLISAFSMTSKWNLAYLKRAWPPVVYTLFLLMPISAVWQNHDRVDLSDDWEDYLLGRRILEQPLDQDAVILADSEKMPPLYYLQVAEGVRPDLDIVVMYDEAAYRAEMLSRVKKGQTVYLGRYLPHLAPGYSLQSVGPLVEINPDRRIISPHSVAVTFGAQIMLGNFRPELVTVAAGERTSITLEWQALSVPDDSYLVTFRLLDLNGIVVQEWPGRVPVSHMYPTNAWPIDIMISDYYSLRFDHTITPGGYRLQVGLFPPFSDLGLLSGDNGIPWETITSITILPSASAAEISQNTRIRMGQGLWLLGYDLSSSVVPGSAFDLILHWTTLEQNSQPVLVEIKHDDVVLDTVNIPVNAFSPGQPFSTRARLTAPNRDGSMNLQISRPGHFTRCGWLTRRSTSCSLGVVLLEGVDIGANAVNFDDRIALESLEVLTPEAHPGEMAIVQARWRSLQHISKDYTIFVHLIGPDGRVHGQVDIWPAQGTLPTSQWKPDQFVDDRFEIYLPPDVPVGEYHVEIGWYLLATMERLPVLSSDGMQITDNYLHPGLFVR